MATPLANDPETLTDYAMTMGLDPSCFQFSEVFGFEPEELAFIPRPVNSVIFLYPGWQPVEEEETNEVPTSNGTPEGAEKPWFMKQRVPGVCGTIAILHSVGNNQKELKIVPDSRLDKFLKLAETMTPDERGDLLNEPDNLEECERAAVEDTTPVLETSATNHFVTFVTKGGMLYLLDGYFDEPRCIGPCTDLLTDSLQVIQTEFVPHIDNIMNMAICTFGVKSE